MADKLFENMQRVYEKASKGEIYPDAMIAAESWFRFRMGDEAFEEALQTGRARYICGLDEADSEYIIWPE